MSTSQYAFLFDLNGTMVNDMEYHITAWQQIANSLGANLSFEDMKAECYGKNEELVERILPGKFSVEERAQIGREKENQYRINFKPFLSLIDGLLDFLTKSHQQNIQLAIGSAAIMENIDFVVDGLNIRNLFGSFVSGDQVVRSKPHPETFLKCAQDLKIAPKNCIVFEDSPKGVESAQNAGMKSIVITTLHPKNDFSQFENVLFFIEDYQNLSPQQCIDALINAG